MIYFELESNDIAATVYNSHKDAFFKHMESRSINRGTAKGTHTVLLEWAGDPISAMINSVLLPNCVISRALYRNN
jgi:hypothetical protein